MGGQVLPLVQPRATVEAQGQIKATPRQVLPLGGMVEGDMAQVMVVAMKGVMDMGHQCHHGNKVIAIEETGFLEIKVPQCKIVEDMVIPTCLPRGTRSKDPHPQGPCSRARSSWYTD